MYGVHHAVVTFRTISVMIGCLPGAAASIPTDLRLFWCALVAGVMLSVVPRLHCVWCAVDIGNLTVFAHDPTHA
jgi:hypothetical protein